MPTFRRAATGAARLLSDRAVLVAVPVLAALAVLTAAGSSLVLQDGERSSTQSSRVTAELAAAYVDAQLTGVGDLVTTWTERPALLATLQSARDGALPAESAPEGFRLAESLRLAKQQIQYAFLTDARGISLANSPRSDAALGASFADRDWFQGAVRTGRTYTSEVYRARVTTGLPWVVAVAAPVYAPGPAGDRGPLLGVVAATYGVADLQAFLDRTVAGEEAMELVDHNGRVVARSGEPAAVGASAGDDPLVVAARGGEEGADRRTVAGEDVVAAWRPLETPGWALTVREPSAAALADSRRSAAALGTLAAVLLATVVVAAVGYRIGRERRRAALAQVAVVRRTTEERFGALYRASPVGIIEGSPDGTVYSVNQAMADMLGYTPEEMVGTNASVYAHPDSSPDIGAAMQAVLAGTLRSYTVERSYRHRDGHAVPVLVSLSTVTRPDGSVERLVAAVTDISDLREKDRALRSSEERFRTAFEASLLGMVLLDEDGRVLQANAAAEQFFARASSALHGVELQRLAGEQDRAALEDAVATALGGGSPRLELAFPVPGGPPRWGLLGLVATPGAEGALLVQVEDVTERRAAEQLLSTQALHDALTHLPNRRLLLERLKHSLQGMSRTPYGPRPALLFIDLDGFKSVNDRFGHETGDALLQDVADRLRAQVRPADTVARLGGDEFVVLDEAVDDAEALRGLASRLLDVLSGPWPPGQQLTASIGVAIAQPGQTAEGLLRDADHAMYRAKQLGKNRFEAYDEQLRASAERRLRIEDELRSAMDHAGLALAFQPVVGLADLHVTGVEALLRLRRPGRAPLEAADFIEVAEDSGLVVPLGRWVIDEACRYAASRHRELGTWLPVAVNVSARQAARADLEEVVLGCLAEHGVPGHVLALEITESVLLSAGRSTLRQLDDLRGAGVQIGLDDFGTGFSSLSYLAELPLDFLKVDRSFVVGLPDDRTSRAIVESTVGLALRLGLRCVVEGIERQAQLEVLRELGPVEGQGYLLARPIDPHRLTHLLAGVPVQRSEAELALVW